MERDTSALAPAPVPVAVVSPQFCAPHAVSLTVTKDMSFSGGDFTVTDDASGAVVLQVRGTYLSVRRHRVLHDAAGRAILTMQRKVRNSRYTADRFVGRRVYLSIVTISLFLASAGCASMGVQKNQSYSYSPRLLAASSIRIQYEETKIQETDTIVAKFP